MSQALQKWIPHQKKEKEEEVDTICRDLKIPPPLPTIFYHCKFVLLLNWEALLF